MKICSDCVHYAGVMPSGISGYCRRKIKDMVTGEIASLGGDLPTSGSPYMFAEFQRRWLDQCGPEARFFEKKAT